MTIYYVDSHGSNTSPYDTWAKAATALATIHFIDVAGDTIYIAHDHAESSAGPSYNWAGTVANPTKLICANTGAQPPTALATTGEIASTVAITPTNTGCTYWYGLVLSSGVGAATTFNIRVGATTPGIFENCTFFTASTGGNSEIGFDWANSQGATRLKNCNFKFGAAGHTIFGGGSLVIDGGSILSGGTSPTNFISAGVFGTKTSVSGFDFTNASSSINLVNTADAGSVTFSNCKLPSSWSGALCTTRPTSLGRVALHNCDSSATNYRLWIVDAVGDITSETTLIRTGGANDGTTGLSWKMVTTADAKWNLPLITGEFVQWNGIVGSAITATVEILHDSSTALKDNEVWLEMQYLGASGQPLGSFINDGVDILAAGSDQTTSSATWTTSGMSNPNKQKLSVTFTPQMKGFIHAVVKMAKTSYTVYVDPKITIS